MNGRLAYIVPATFLLLGACTLDYEGAAIDAGETEIPQLELFNVTMYVSRDTSLELRAEHVATYRERNVQEMKSVTFREYGPDGELRVEGLADAATLFLESEDVELSGDIRFLSTIEDAEVISDYLYWDNEERALTAAGEEVRLLRSDGSEIVGRGLRLDGRRNSVEFSSGVSGSYIVGEGEE